MSQGSGWKRGGNGFAVRAENRSFTPEKPEDTQERACKRLPDIVPECSGNLTC